MVYFKTLPPKKSETSRISAPMNGLKNLHTNKMNIIAIMVIYIRLIHEPVPEALIMIDGIFSIKLLKTTVINRAIASSLLIFSMLFIIKTLSNSIF